MARKRMTDIEIWKKKWFRKLEPEYKCFWSYVRDNCNHAGIWDVDFELASYHIGAEIKEKDVKDIFKEHFIELENDKWYLKEFVDFQYGKLKGNNNAHISVIKILTKYNLLDSLGAGQGLKNSPSSAPLEKDKEKVQVKGKDKEKDMEKDKVFECSKCKRGFTTKEYISFSFKCPDCKVNIIEIKHKGEK